MTTTLNFRAGESYRIDSVPKATVLPVDSLGRVITFTNVIIRFTADDGTTTMAVGRNDGAISMFRAPDRVSKEALLKSRHPHLGAVTSLAFCAQRNTLFSGSSDRTIKVWNACADRGSPETLIQTLTGHSSSVTGLVDSGQSFMVSCSADCSVRLWREHGIKGEYACSQVLHMGADSRQMCTGLIVSHEVKGMNPWTMYCSDALGGITTFCLEKRGSSVVEIAASVTWSKVHTLAITQMLLVPEHNLLISLSFDCNCVVIERNRGSVVSKIQALLPTLQYSGVEWSSFGNQLLLTDRDGGLTVWSLYDKRVVAHHKLASRLNPDSYLVAREGRAVREAAKDLSAAAALQWVGPRTLACVMPNKAHVQQLFVEDYQPPVEFLGHSGAVVGLAIVEPGNKHPRSGNIKDAESCREIMLVSAAEDFSVRVWDSSTLKERFELLNNLKNEDFEPSCMLSLPHINQLVVGDQFGTIAFVHPDRGLLIKQTGHTNTVTGAAFVWVRSQHRSEEFLATSSFDGSLGLWMLYKGNQFDPHIFIRIENAHGFGWGDSEDDEGLPCEVLCVAFHTPSQLILSGGNDALVRCWCSLDHSERYLLRGHSSAVTCCSANEKNALAFTGSEDACVIAWNLGYSRVLEGRLETLGPLYTLSGHSGAIRCLLQLPFANKDGQIYLASASEDTLIKIWACQSIPGEAKEGAATANETKDFAGEELDDNENRSQAQHILDIDVCKEANIPSSLNCTPPREGPPRSIFVGSTSGSIFEVQLPEGIFDWR